MAPSIVEIGLLLRRSPPLAGRNYCYYDSYSINDPARRTGGVPGLGNGLGR